MAVALITGTSTGIGFESALAFARAGHRTWATMRNLDKAEPLRAAAQAEGLVLEIAQLDVTDEDSIARAFRQVDEREGRVDILINNAGIGGASPLELVPEAEHRGMFEVNYWGAIRTIQAVLPGMRERGEGAIVNVTSGAGRFATPNQVPYTASKFALEGASEALAYELRPFGVRVALVEPGIVDTAIIENSAHATRYDRNSPYRNLMRRNGWMYVAYMKNPGQASDVAAVVLAAATDPQPKLRYLVGGAEDLVGGRNSLSDEEFLALAELDDDAYRARFKQVFGIAL